MTKVNSNSERTCAASIFFPDGICGTSAGLAPSAEAVRLARSAGRSGGGRGGGGRAEGGGGRATARGGGLSAGGGPRPGRCRSGLARVAFFPAKWYQTYSR